VLVALSLPLVLVVFFLILVFAVASSCLLAAILSVLTLARRLLRGPGGSLLLRESISAASTAVAPLLSSTGSSLVLVWLLKDSVRLCFGVRRGGDHLCGGVGGLIGVGCVGLPSVKAFQTKQKKGQKIYQTRLNSSRSRIAQNKQQQNPMDFSNLSTAREQSQKTTKFMNIFLAKMNRNFLTTVAWGCPRSNGVNACLTNCPTSHIHSPRKTKRPFLRTSLAGEVAATRVVLLRLLRWAEEGGRVADCCTEDAGEAARSLRSLAAAPRRFFLSLLAARGAGELPAMNAGRMVNTPC